MSATFVVGDVHGQYGQLLALLHTDTRLISHDGHWQGADAVLCFSGDYTDRGPDGLAVIDLVMRLQVEAQAAGGKIHALIGNHEVALLAAAQFKQVRTAGFFLQRWLSMGGHLPDLQGLTLSHRAWLQSLPAMLRVEDALYIHADSAFYLDYGRSVDAVNANISRILQGDNPRTWENLLDQFSDRYAFSATNWFGEPITGGEKRAHSMLNTFGGAYIIHGHTPIFRMTQAAPQTVTEPLRYCAGLCVNVDGGMYKGGSGVIYALEPQKI